MNMTDDGEALVGEAPELTMPRVVVSFVERQTQALSEIRELHYTRSCRDGCCEECDACSVPPPCDTVAILDRLGV